MPGLFRRPPQPQQRPRQLPPVASAGTQTVIPDAIASDEAFGTATVVPGSVTVIPTAIDTAEAFGATAVTQVIAPAGIATEEAFGAATVVPGSVTISAAGAIASTEAIGTAVIVHAIAPGAIATAEAMGAPTVVPGSVTISPTAIGPDEAFGTAVVNVIQRVIPTAIASSEGFGLSLDTGLLLDAGWLLDAGATVVRGGITISPTAIASAEAVGTPTVNLVVAPGAIASAEAFGTAILAPGPVTVSPTAIATTEAFGTAAMVPGPVTVSPTAIAPAEAFGVAAVRLVKSIYPSAIASTEAFSLTLDTGLVLDSGLLLDSGATVRPGAVTVSPTAIASAEALGAPAVHTALGVSAIASLEAFGTAVLVPGSVTVSAAGAIASSEAFGTPSTLLLAITISPSGIATVEAFGTPFVDQPAPITATGIASAEAFGAVVVLPGPVTISPSGIASSEAIGVVVVRVPIAPAGIASLEAFGTAQVWGVYRYRRLHAIQYHALLFDDDANGGPGIVKAELDPHLLNLVWSQAQNLSGQAAFALSRRSSIFDKIEWMVDHLKIYRETASGTQTVFAGKLVAPVLSTVDAFAYALDYLGFLQLSITGYRTAYANKFIGSQVISPEWALAKALTNSPFAFVNTGTIEDPLGLDGVTKIQTNADFGVVLFDRLFTFNTLAEMSMANTQNNVKFEITRDAPHTFNLWKNYGSNKTSFVAQFPGNIASKDFDGGRDGIRHDLTSVISDGAGGQVSHNVLAADANTTNLRRLQGAVAIRTLFGATGGTTETDQAKAALARQLVVATRYPRMVRITPRQGELDLFNGWNLGDKFRHIIQKPDRSGDFYDGYLRATEVVGAWSPENGELVDLFSKGIG